MGSLLLAACCYFVLLPKGSTCSLRPNGSDMTQLAQTAKRPTHLPWPQSGYFGYTTPPNHITHRSGTGEVTFLSRHAKLHRPRRPELGAPGRDTHTNKNAGLSSTVGCLWPRRPERALQGIEGEVTASGDRPELPLYLYYHIDHPTR